jgi:hypothetical protein
MNERMVELARQAGLKKDHSSDREYIGDFDWRLFGDLIVGECIEQCSKALVEHTGQPSVTHNYAVGLCQDSIKEHFGVE